MQIQNVRPSATSRPSQPDSTTMQPWTVLFALALYTYVIMPSASSAIYLKTRYRGYLAGSGPIAHPRSKQRVGPTSSSMPSSSPTLTSFFFSIRVPHMAASGHGPVRFSALWSLQFFENGYLIVIACDNCDSVRGRGGRHAWDVEI